MRVNRKMIKPDFLNTLNYMFCSRGNFPHYETLGLIPITGEYQTWGVEVEGTSYTVASLFYSEGYWGSDHRETEELAKEKPWVVFFTGNDDSSFFNRFATKQEAIQYFNDLKEVNSEDCLYFN